MDSHDKIFLDMYIISCMYAPKAPKQKKHRTTERYAHHGKYKILAIPKQLKSTCFHRSQPPSWENKHHSNSHFFSNRISSFAKPLFVQNHPHSVSLIISSGNLFPSKIAIPPLGQMHSLSFKVLPCAS